MQITLICSAGMSTSMLVARMDEAAKKRGLDVVISAHSWSNLEKVIDQTDILLIGPQLSYVEEDLRVQYPDMPMAVIDSIKYGTMNGDAVLDDALALQK